MHRKIILEIENRFSSTSINTNSNPNSNITASKQNNEFFLRNFKYPSFSRSKFSLVCVAHNITTSASFTDITEVTKKILAQTKAFLRINRWNVDELNIVNIGWIYGAHPVSHNRDRIYSTIKTYCKNTNKSIPTLEIFSKTISSSSSPRKRISTKAIQFACRKDESNEIKTILQECFSDPKTFLPGKFIPSDLSYKQGQDVYSQYICHQNKYLSDHRTINIIGIHPNDLHLTVNESTSLIEQIQSCHLIDWISPTNRTMSNGRFLLSTDKERYQDAIVWIDQTLLPKCDLLHNKQNFPHEPELKPTRISASPKTDDYSSFLATSIKTITDTTFTRPPNAWNKPISIIASSTPQTSVSRITDSSNQSSMEQQIKHLTQQVNDLQLQIKTSQEINHTIIAKAVETAIDKHHNRLEKQYHQMIQSVNDHWKQITSSLPMLLHPQNKINTFSSSSSPPTTPIRKNDEKRSRENNQSGSNRHRKPRRYSSSGLESVQKSITYFLDNSKPPDPQHTEDSPHDATMNDD